MTTPRFTRSEERVLWAMDWPNRALALVCAALFLLGATHDFVTHQGDIYDVVARWGNLLFLAALFNTLNTFKSILRKTRDK